MRVYMRAWYDLTLTTLCLLRISEALASIGLCHSLGRRNDLETYRQILGSCLAPPMRSSYSARPRQDDTNRS